MIVDRTTGPFRNVGGIPDMVPVSVGEKEGVWLDFLFLKKIEEAFGGIDREKMAVEIQKVGIRCGKTAGVGQKLIHLGLGWAAKGLRVFGDKGKLGIPVVRQAG